LANLKPLSKEKELLLPDKYDGIQELDNAVPVWFNVLFYGTIAFGFLYWFAYHSWQLAPLQEQEYENEMHIAQIAKAERLKNAPADNVNESNVALVTEAGVLNAGKVIYVQY
jgi:cytochrome c oxidase cbb3-type subunit 3